MFGCVCGNVREKNEIHVGFCLCVGCHRERWRTEETVPEKDISVPDCDISVHNWAWAHTNSYCNDVYSTLILKYNGSVKLPLIKCNFYTTSLQ